MTKKQIEKKFKVKIKKKLGAGVWGSAYLLTDRKTVLKLTTNIDEYDTAKRLIKRPSKNICKILRIEKLKNERFAIFREYTKSLDTHNKQLIEAMECRCTCCTKFIKASRKMNLYIKFSKYDIHSDNVGISLGHGVTPKGELVLFDP